MKKSRYGNEISLWKNLAMNQNSRYEKISLCKNLAMKKSRYERTSPWKGLTMKWCYTLSTYALYLRDPSFSQIDVRYILSWHMLLQARPRKIMWDFCVKFVWNLVPETTLRSRPTPCRAPSKTSSTICRVPPCPLTVPHPRKYCNVCLIWSPATCPLKGFHPKNLAKSCQAASKSLHEITFYPIWCPPAFSTEAVEGSTASVERSTEAPDGVWPVKYRYPWARPLRQWKVPLPQWNVPLRQWNAFVL